MFLNPNIFSNLNYNCSNLWDMRNLQEQVKKAFCYQKLFWPFTVWINCSSDLKIFANSRPSASNFKSFSQSVEQFFLTVGLSVPTDLAKWGPSGSDRTTKIFQTVKRMLENGAKTCQNLTMLNAHVYIICLQDFVIEFL